MQKETEIYQNAKILEDFFEQLLEKWLPQYAFDSFEDDDDDQLTSESKKRKKRENDPPLHIR